MIGRRSTLLGGALLACTRRNDGGALLHPGPESPATSGGPPDAGAYVRVIEWTFGPASPSPFTVVLVPGPFFGDREFPAIVALHGRGEAVKDPRDGAWGWPRDYALVRAYSRMTRPPLTRDDFEGFVDAGRLSTINRELLALAFRGLIVACPYTPDVDPHSSELDPFRHFVVDTLVPRLERETPMRKGARALGIDGVSLGGAAALRIGLDHPTLFATVGSLQAAVRPSHARSLTQKAVRARAEAPRLALRLVTSADDPFRSAIAQLSTAWKGAGVTHEFLETPGPHDYAYNRGPGACELLFWHERALA